MPATDIRSSLQQFVRTLTEHPGIYKMLDAQDHILYVGKARNLRKRVMNYVRAPQTLDPKTQSLMAQVNRIEVTVTSSETEALLLENSLIKEFHPKYNILLRDDKSYPFIYLSPHSDFPRLEIRRGRINDGGHYFGPYPSSHSARQSLNLLQKLFRIRNCTDSFFSSRSRPCIQYQLKRCTAPCVNYVTKKDYQQDLKNAILFLQGKNKQVIDELARQMQVASTACDYERAAVLRDQIASLRYVQTQQYVVRSQVDCDILALVQRHGHACVQILSVRHGQLLGSRPFWLKVPFDDNPGEILQAVISQHYLLHDWQESIPKLLIVSHEIAEREFLEKSLSTLAKHRVRILQNVRGDKAKLLALGLQNAEQALVSHLASQLHQQQQWQALQEWLKLDVPLQRIECFDASHSMGESTLVSCVVADENGPNKRLYRKFNIAADSITPGDDYAALRQALRRRYSRLIAENTAFPEVVIIDGGKGQLHTAEEVFAELGVAPLILMSISKGEARKPGLEQLWFSGFLHPQKLPADSPILHALQHIRDEAHRFAITGHRKKQQKKRITSVLETVPGIGKKKRLQLLQAFGGLVELKRTSVEEIAKVPGISLELAQRIYDTLR